MAKPAILSKGSLAVCGLKKEMASGSFLRPQIADFAVPVLGQFLLESFGISLKAHFFCSLIP